MRLLDLFCGRWGWSKAFAARGWLCFGIDLVESPKPAEFPERHSFTKADVLWLTPEKLKNECIDFVCASSPCDEFACFQMRHFQRNPPYPELGIKLFNHTRQICEAAEVPYVLENVRAAQQFVGPAIRHAGSFYLWGNAVPPLLPKIHKARWRKNAEHGRTAPGNFAAELLLPKQERKALLATIPPELANCVADYAERLLENRPSQAVQDASAGEN